MKTFRTTAAIVITLTAPAFARMGLTAGSEAAGEPFNSSFRQSAKPPGGYTPGARAQARVYVKKKKRSSVSATGSARVRASGY
jgi:hypothetical protein